MDDLQELVEEYMDDKGDVPPPWAIYPHLSRNTIGWRMGYGEGAMLAFCTFLRSLDADQGTRLALLKRHAPAPYTWANWIDAVIFNPGNSPPNWLANDPDVRQRHDWQLEHGLLASDVAYPTWIEKQEGRLRLPWENNPSADSPAITARFNTRAFAFMSRQLQGHKLPEPPLAWRLTEAVPPTQGLLCLAQQLLSGHVRPPWDFQLETEAFQNTYADDMGYADAFRLWVRAAFDDAEHFKRYLDSVAIPPESWRRWLTEHAIPEF